MALDELRKKVIYQNSVDVWIALCEEKNLIWNNHENYKKFIKYLHDESLNLKKFPFCVSDSESINEKDKLKAKFADALSESGDPNAAAFTVKLNDTTLETIRNFKL
jgi:hypothetical protein